MAKRLYVPKTNPEAERFLWHAYEHIAMQEGSGHSRQDFKDFKVIMMNAVHLVTCDEWEHQKHK